MREEEKKKPGEKQESRASRDRKIQWEILKKYSQTYIDHLCDEGKPALTEAVHQSVDTYLSSGKKLSLSGGEGGAMFLSEDPAVVRKCAEYLSRKAPRTFLNLSYVMHEVMGLKRQGFLLWILGTLDPGFAEDRRTIRGLTPRFRGSCVDKLCVRLSSTGILQELDADITDTYSWEAVYRQLQKNPKLGKAAEKLNQEFVQIQELNQHVLKTIPDDYIDLYPAARAMHRKFYLHIGPTNSGKTYRAIQALEKAEHGIYLGPLRLLAYEQYETMNYDGCPCSLLTGEEEIQIPFSRVQASTIEMAAMKDVYDIAVIDEAQMMADEERGGYWSQAVLGLCASQIHVCAAPYAEKILIQMITDCGDEYEVEHLERLVPLEADRRTFRFPQSIQDGDALILFSRKDVHACAAELSQRKIPCSVIYGTLPYDVRHEQARKFTRGETKVLIATDAVGMGLNLPIRRVVFLKHSKFDGKEQRDLKPSEIQQIAGRAGRYQRYDVGYYTAYGERQIVDEGAEEPIEDITEAVIGFPTSLLNIDAPISEIMRKWQEIPVHEGYRQMKLDDEQMLAEELEKRTQDKNLIYNLITIPFDVRSEQLMSLWEELADITLSGRRADFYALKPKVSLSDYTSVNMELLEMAYKECDLLYAYFRKFGYPEYLKPTMLFKDQISDAIIIILKKQNFSRKTCRRCGRTLSFLSVSNLCERCYEQMKRERYTIPGNRRQAARSAGRQEIRRQEHKRQERSRQGCSRHQTVSDRESADT